MIIQITGSNLLKTITIGNICRPPRSCNDNIKNVIDEFTTLSTLENNSNLIITGDFNINLLKINENRIYSDYFELCYCMQPFQK